MEFNPITRRPTMLNRVIRFATRHPKRVIAIWLATMLALAAVSAGFGYKVVSDDTAQFLPKGSESARAIEFAEKEFGREKGTRAVTMLVKRSDARALSEADRDEIHALATAMQRWRLDTEAPGLKGQFGDLSTRAGAIVNARSGPMAPDGRFQLIALDWRANTTDPVAQELFRQVRDRVVERAREHDLRVGFTGGVASRADQVKAQEATKGLSQVLLFGSVILLSLLFFRAPLAAIVPLVAIYLVAAGASGLVVLSALAFDFTLDVSTPQLITVVLVGIGIDYFLFLLFRLRERLRLGEGRRTAAARAAAGVGPVIASAALAIVAAFGTMLLAEFGQFRVIGPAVAISVLVMLIAGVTLMPAIAAVTGRALFWPSRSWTREHADGLAARLGRRIARTPRRAAFAVIAVLVVLASSAVGMAMSYDQTDGGGASTPAARTADEIVQTLPQGAGDPQQVYLRASGGGLTAADIEPLRERLGEVDGVGAVGEAELTADRRAARVDVALEHDPPRNGRWTWPTGPCPRQHRAPRRRGQARSSAVPPSRTRT
jgi:RND superfamily putative drug exporter